MHKILFRVVSLLAIGIVTIAAMPARAVTASPSPSATSAASPSASSAPTPCSAAKQLKDPDLGTPYVYVVNLDTKQVLLNLRGQSLTPTASVMKLVTVAWATKYLPMSYTAQTKVLVDPNEPSTIILKGGGDHTLSQLSGASYSTYGKRSARLETLVNQTLALWPSNQPIKKILIDSTFFEGGGWNKNWNPAFRASGDMSLITALQLDGDRKNPDLTDTNYSSIRSPNPIEKTANLFRSKLGQLANGAKIVYGKSPTAATDLTKVNSRAMVNWMRHALMVSDNTETEMIAFHAAKAANLPATWGTTSTLAKRFMRSIGIKPTGFVFNDTSGLAETNRLTAKSVVAVVQAIYDDTSNLNQVKSLLPVSGTSGSLANRLTGELRGKVTAKVGYISGLVSLAGFIDAKDGTHLGFGIFARKLGNTKLSSGTKPAIDRLVKRLYYCGAGLTR